LRKSASHTNCFQNSAWRKACAERGEICS
jgi:hypothetical protein